MYAAQCSGVQPAKSRRLGSAPPASSARAVSRPAASSHTQCSAERPSSSRDLSARPRRGRRSRQRGEEGDRGPAGERLEDREQSVSKRCEQKVSKQCEQLKRERLKSSSKAAQKQQSEGKIKDSCSRALQQSKRCGRGIKSKVRDATDPDTAMPKQLAAGSKSNMGGRLEAGNTCPAREDVKAGSDRTAL
eukprot:356058-Chlamydomonas_euryale.AAC.2